MPKLAHLQVHHRCSVPSDGIPVGHLSFSVLNSSCLFVTTPFPEVLQLAAQHHKDKYTWKINRVRRLILRGDREGFGTLVAILVYQMGRHDDASHSIHKNAYRYAQQAERNAELLSRVIQQFLETSARGHQFQGSRGKMPECSCHEAVRSIKLPSSPNSVTLIRKHPDETDGVKTCAARVS